MGGILIKNNIEKFNERFKIGDIVKHFKSEQFIYEIVGLAHDTTNHSDCVVYKPLYQCEFTMFTRSVSEFISEVDKSKYPESKQRYRFEVVTDE